MTKSNRLKQETLKAIREGDIHRALVASNLAGARLVFVQDGKECEIPLSASGVWLSVSDTPLKAPGISEVDLNVD